MLDRGGALGDRTAIALICPAARWESSLCSAGKSGPWRQGNPRLAKKSSWRPAAHKQETWSKVPFFLGPHTQAILLTWAWDQVLSRGGLERQGLFSGSRGAWRGRGSAAWRKLRIYSQAQPLQKTFCALQGLPHGSHREPPPEAPVRSGQPTQPSHWTLPSSAGMWASCPPLACTCPKPPPAWAPAMGGLKEKGLSIKKGISTPPLVLFLLKISTSGAATHLGLRNRNKRS